MASLLRTSGVTFEPNSMPDFYSVADEFENLTGRYQFNKPEKLWYPHFIALSKQLEDHFYCYVTARMHRSNGALETALWVGPLNRPDDGLENLSANIKVQIGYIAVPTVDFFKNCEAKIIGMIESGELAPLLFRSKRELTSPSLENRRYTVYTRYLLPFFNRILEVSGGDAGILRNKKSCGVLIGVEFDSLMGEPKLFFDQLGITATTEKMWELCYLYSCNTRI